MPLEYPDLTLATPAMIRIAVASNAIRRIQQWLTTARYSPSGQDCGLSRLIFNAACHLSQASVLKLVATDQLVDSIPHWNRCEFRPPTMEEEQFEAALETLIRCGTHDALAVVLAIPLTRSRLASFERQAVIAGRIDVFISCRVALSHTSRHEDEYYLESTDIGDAYQSGNETLISWFTEMDQPVSMKRALDGAAAGGQLALVRELVEQGIEPSGQTLANACEKSHQAVAKYIVTSLNDERAAQACLRAADAAFSQPNLELAIFILDCLLANSSQHLPANRGFPILLHDLVWAAAESGQETHLRYLYARFPLLKAYSLEQIYIETALGQLSVTLDCLLELSTQGLDVAVPYLAQVKPNIVNTAAWQRLAAARKSASLKISE